MNEVQITGKLEELYKELLRANAQRATNTPPENPGRVKAIRRTISKLYTILNQKKKQMQDKIEVKREEKPEKVKKQSREVRSKKHE